MNHRLQIIWVNEMPVVKEPNTMYFRKSGGKTLDFCFTNPSGKAHYIVNSEIIEGIAADVVANASIGANQISQNSSSRLVSDAQIDDWNAKQPEIASGAENEFFSWDKTWRLIKSKYISDFDARAAYISSQTSSPLHLNIVLIAQDENERLNGGLVSQNGDAVKQLDTGMTYILVDETDPTKLSNWVEFAANLNQAGQTFTGTVISQYGDTLPYPNAFEIRDPLNNLTCAFNAFEETSLSIGKYAGSDSPSAFRNVNVGYHAGEDGTNNTYCTMIGTYAGSDSIASNQSVAVGTDAMQHNYGTNASTIVGAKAGRFGTSYQRCSLFGWGAATKSNGDDNNIFGANAAVLHENGDENSIFGSNVLAKALETNRTAIFGNTAFKNVIYADDLTALGYNAGETLIQGSHVTLIGANADVPTANIDDYLNIEDVIKARTGSTKMMGFFNAEPVPQPVVAGSRASGAAFVSLLNALTALNLITNSTTT